MGLFDFIKKIIKPSDQQTVEVVRIKEFDADKAKKSTIDETPVVEQVSAEEFVIAIERDMPNKMQQGLNRTRAAFSSLFASMTGQQAVTSEFFDDLEDLLVSSDIGLSLSSQIVNDLRENARSRGLINTTDVRNYLKQKFIATLESVPELPILYPDKLNVIMLLGVNGSGKTTTIAKLSQRCLAMGLSVMCAAADTFRAAADSQLRIWADRVGVPVISGQQNADPSSVIFDACRSAISKDIKVLIIDTAGRLQNQQGLMRELQKMEQTVNKAAPDANRMTLLTIDATVGQNARSQVKLFSQVAQIHGLVLTKLDGSAKGGIVISLCLDHKIPVAFVGVGEGVSDLIDFDPKLFVNSMLGDD